MNKYEMTVVFKPTLDDEALRNEHEQIIEILERFEGTVEKVDDWGKRKLAYEIEKITEGVYRFITFNGPDTAPAEIESRMRIRENILRYLIIRTDIDEAKAQRAKEARKAMEARSAE